MVQDCLGQEIKVGDYLLAPGPRRHKNLHLFYVTKVTAKTVSVIGQYRYGRERINDTTLCVKIPEGMAQLHERAYGTIQKIIREEHA
jgi:hypothetical protein